MRPHQRRELDRYFTEKNDRELRPAASAARPAAVAEPAPTRTLHESASLVPHQPGEVGRWCVSYRPSNEPPYFPAKRLRAGSPQDLVRLIAHRLWSDDGARILNIWEDEHEVDHPSRAKWGRF